jgi:mono/diheme cytochrome c family protein
MHKFISFASITVLVSAALLAMAQQATPKVANVPIQQTSVSSGPQMYTNYCASCHGANATGNGPAAPALRFPPTDLTTLSKNNGGVFPSAHIVTVLQFGVESPAHGSANMPVWGDLMLSLHSGNSNPDMLVRQRIANLTAYLKKLQK